MNQKPNKKQNSIFRKISEWLHLWLSLISGIVVFVVCLTGALWVFRYEVFFFTEKYQFVEPQKKTFLLPGKLIASGKEYLENKENTTVNVSGITYGKQDKSVVVNFEWGTEGDEKFANIYLNPYTGKFIYDKRKASAAENFFIFVRAGHRFFWLPQKIGSPVVGIACIIFLLIIITGLIWWYPKKWNSKTREKSFKIKWNAKWKRVNIDLHNVLGFYSSVLLIIFCITGVVFTFRWFEHGIYTALTGKSFEEFKPPFSDTTLVTGSKIDPVNFLYQKAIAKHGTETGRIFISIPEKAKQTYMMAVNFGDGTILYNNDVSYYDQKNLKEIKADGLRGKNYTSLSLGQKIFKMNFDIHTGQILGLPTKIITFLICIIGASLPVTGTIIWYNRKWGKTKKKP